MKSIALLRTCFSKFSRRRKIFRQTDPDRDQRETDPRPKTGPDRTGFRYRSDKGDEHNTFLGLWEEGERAYVQEATVSAALLRNLYC